jgi:hypothetical protein
MRARLRRGGRYFTRLWRVFDLWGGGRFWALGFSDALCSAPDGRAYFLLLRQKKVAKEKATPRHRSFGMKLQRSSLRCSTCRAAAELALRAQTVLADCPRPVSAARRRRGDQRQYRVEMRAAAVSVSFGFDLSCPVRRRATEGGAEKGEDCLSPQGEFRSPRPSRVAQGTPKGRQAGRAFFLATFSWQDKKKYARPSGAEYSASDKQKKTSRKENGQPKPPVSVLQSRSSLSRQTSSRSAIHKPQHTCRASGR